ncbi:MAG TPA: sigma 54-interacting transcriptional regulator [Candidatus Sulfotelmatobacter sp.]|nr:sigma 54-interacting transcriptional regulator [Candidatus Sulfotelmatobacter sp.]
MALLAVGGWITESQRCIMPAMASSGRASESFNIQLLVDSIPALIHTARPDGYLDYFNKPWLEYLGATLEQVSGWNWKAFIHPEDVEGIVTEWLACLASGETFEYETRVRRADGEYRWMFHRKVPLRDEHGNIVKWYGSSMDIEGRKRAKEAEDQLQAVMSERMRLATVRAEIAVALASKETLRGILHRCAETLVRHLDAAFARIWTLKSGCVELELEASAGMYTRLDGRFSRIPIGKIKIGLIAQQGKAHLTNDVQNDPHISDHNWARTERMQSFAGYPLVVEERVVGVMGMFSRQPLTETTLELLASIADAIAQGIERKRVEEQLKRSEAYLAEGQRLARTGGWGFNPSGTFDYWSEELFRIYGLDPAGGPPSLDRYLACVHPRDRTFMAETIQKMVAEGLGCDLKKKIVRPDGEHRYIRCVGVPVIEHGVLKRIVGTAMDVTEQEHLTQELQRREAYLAQAQRLGHTGSFGWRVSSGEIFWSDETFRIFECDTGTKPAVELVLARVHPVDRDRVQHQIGRATRDGKGFDLEHRLQMPGGSIKHVRVTAHPSRDRDGNLEFVGAVTDISEQRQAEAVIREQERELQQILDLAPQHIRVLRPDGSPFYFNRAALEYFGASFNQWRAKETQLDLVHAEDREKFLSERKSRFLEGAPHEFEARLLRHDGQFRWHLFRLNPLKDEHGKITRWYGAATDIEDRKQAEDGLRRENIALREEIDKVSMFEEIVGTSPALQTVISHISKVARSDSTVLISGETGTGKELVARAIHRRSGRASRAFVSVNCAAIPRDLIASELFGHEKGAFTGATQQRLGRFELANGGTIFLDEIGELPPETQIALLRVLQEHEFERVGGARPIRVDVRVIAATNRDLQAALHAGSFRSDLYYRLNVFPIEIPPLRERRDDIPLLIAYFVDRYARKASKHIRDINKKTLELLQSYPWPGNIRELQNVVERSVLLCETEIFSIDETWLPRPPLLTEPRNQTELSRSLLAQEKNMIEAALSESRGRVFGPSGAAVKLGIPRSTLESKIRSLKIDKNRFKSIS